MDRYLAVCINFLITAGKISHPLLRKTTHGLLLVVFLFNSFLCHIFTCRRLVYESKQLKTDESIWFHTFICGFKIEELIID